MTSAFLRRGLPALTRTAAAGFVLALTFGNAPVLGDARPETFTITDSGPAPAAKPMSSPLTIGSRHKVADMAEVRLGPVDEAKLVAEDAARTSVDKRFRIAVGRSLAVGAEKGRWSNLPNGRKLWSIDVASDGARALRLHLFGVALPPGAELLTFAPGAPELLGGPYRERGPNADGEIWTPSFTGDRVRIEYTTASGSDAPAALPFTIDLVQHVYRDLPRGGDLQKSAGPCHNDVTCFASFADLAKAVGRITFVSGGDTLVCSGQLINAQNNDLTPYFLTANHCVSTSSEAASVEVFWLYQTSTCNGVAPSENSVPRSVGASLLSTGAGADFTLLMIQGALPSGLSWAGWTANSVPDGTPSVCIHHPAGDFKRISFGTKSSTTSCGPANSVRSNWTDGPTEEGSSGSGLYRSDTQQLYGQLSCGPSACGNETNDDFGAFAGAFDQIETLLAAGSDDAFEENDSCAAARAVANGNFADRVVKRNDEDWYRLTVSAGATVFVRLNFTHDHGDVDARLFASCGGTELVNSVGVTNQEDLAWENTGAADAEVFLQVFLSSSTRNVYRLQVANQPITGGGGGGGGTCPLPICGFCLVPLPLMGIAFGLSLMKWRARRRTALPN